jgi:hypothetical protein
MFCPECGSEYRDEFTTCVDCDVALVDQPPAAEAHTLDSPFVTVLETGDPGLLALAHSILEAEGIPSLFPGEGLQSLFGAGSMGAGFNIAVGPVEIQVPASHAERALELLEGMEDGETIPEEDLPNEESTQEEPS